MNLNFNFISSSLRDKLLSIDTQQSKSLGALEIEVRFGQFQRDKRTQDRSAVYAGTLEWKQFNRLKKFYDSKTSSIDENSIDTVFDSNEMFARFRSEYHPDPKNSSKDVTINLKKTELFREELRDYPIRIVASNEFRMNKIPTSRKNTIRAKKRSSYTLSKELSILT